MRTGKKNALMFPQFRRAAVLHGMVSYWSFDEASGDRSDNLGVSDLSDNNGVTSADGIIGLAADLPGTNQYLTLADTAAMAFTRTNFSYQSWCFPDEAVNDYLVFCRNSTTIRWGLFFLTTTPTVRAFVGSTSVHGTTTNPLNVGAWNHVVLVYDGSLADNATRCKVWLNGVQETLSFTGTVGTVIDVGNTPNMAWGWNGATGYFNGRLDEQAIWNRSLSDAEIKWLWNGGKGRAL